jgi:glycosyltransferase involved in cell wall biosynthesis
MMNSRIVWRALSNKVADGYGYASRKISSGLTMSGIDILSPEDILVSGLEHERLVCITPNGEYFEVPSGRYLDSDVLINNCLPVDYQIKTKYNIGFSYWETNKLPSNWIKNINLSQEIWTTSSWASEVFQESTGHSNVHAFKLGIDSDYFWASDKVNDGPFTFLHVGSPSTRKNSQMAFDAFIKTFGSNKNYRLIIKSVGPTDARWKTDSMNHGAISNHDRVFVIDDEISDYDLGNLYRSAHCLIYPTNGEGWGMIPFNSIGCGLPTICTNATACTEYAGMSVPLDFKWGNENQFGIYTNCGEWAVPSFDDLCDKMIWVANNYEYIKQKTYNSAKIIHKEYSWNTVVSEYGDRLCQILNQ